MGDFYGTGSEIWVVDINEKKIRADYEQLLRPFFQIFVVKEELKIKNIAASALESCIK